MKTKKYIALVASGLLLAFSACNDFDSLNENPNLPTPDMADFNEAKLGSVLRYGIDLNMRDDAGNLNGGGHLHQRLKSLNIDFYSQYLHPGNQGPSNYIPNDSWNFEYWKGHYQWLSSLNEVIIDSQEGGDATLNNIQIARIWRVYIQSQITDYFGPAPFPLIPEKNPDYMPVDKQYELFFSELDEAVKTMNPDLPIIGASDQVYFGNFEKWRQFGNSLRLRLALKVSEVNAELCRTQANAALNAPGGLMAQGGDAEIGGAADWGNQYNYYMYQVTWNGKMVMTSSFEKILKGIGGLDYTGAASPSPGKVDPRGARYFDPSVEANLWKGTKPGLPSGQNSDLDKKNAYMSQIYIIPNSSRKTQAFLYEEICFLLAEAYERGFITGGTSLAKQWYETGVNASLKRWGVGGDAEAYLASTAKNEWGTSANYDDAVGAGNTKLEKIITQKYIANYPDVAYQAWTDKRRLNLPAFDVPVYRNPDAGYDSNNMKIKDPKNFINRQPFPQNEKLVNLDKYNAGVSLLGGTDGVATNIWWDVDANYCTSAD